MEAGPDSLRKDLKFNILEGYSNIKLLHLNRVCPS